MIEVTDPHKLVGRLMAAEAQVEALRKLLGRLHSWFLQAAPEHYRGCGLHIDVAHALNAPAEESAAYPEWRRDFTTLPEIGRKFIALYDDGSGAAMFWRHDGGFIDQDGDDHSAAKNWAASYSAWAYLPNDLEFWCEMLAEDAVILRLPAAPAEARTGQPEGDA